MATDQVWGISMVRNESDILPSVLGHMTRQVDHVLVADNLSTDDTPDILAAAGVEVVIDDDPAYRQSEKMTALAQRARVEFGAEWVIPADADEFWRPRHHATIADACHSMPGDVGVLPTLIFDHVVTGVEGFHNMTHRRAEPTPLHKVACRARPDLVIHMGNHSASYDDPHPVAVWGMLEVRHFPIRTSAQYIRKARQGSAALRLTDLPESSGQHWRDWDKLTDAELVAAFQQHWTFSPSDPSVVEDPL